MLAPMGSVHRRFNKANIEALKALGLEVELCANFENGDGPEIHNQRFVAECKENGIATYSIPFARHSLSGSLKSLPKLKGLLVNGRYDIVHAHTETGGLLLKLAQNVKGGSKFFYTPHGMSFWKGSSLKSQLIYKPLERWICLGMDMNLGMNKEEVECLERWNKCSATYVHGIGLDIKRMQTPISSREIVCEEFGLSKADIFVVSIGELNDNKNHITVIRALAKLNRKDFKYVVCGVGPNKDMLLAEAESLGLKDNVVLAGYRSDIPDILNAADIFVFPSFHEGLPVSALEAMSCGLPVVCSEIRGNVDIVTDGENGYLFQPSDVKILSERLARLMDDKDIRNTMGKRNIAVVKEFSIDSVTEELKRIYSSALFNA